MTDQPEDADKPDTRSSLAGIRAVAITASTRAATGVYPDRGGPIIAETLGAWGATIGPTVVVPDGEAVAAALQEAVTAYDLVITTGGTGCAPTDTTPEATRAVLTREIPGIAEAIRADGLANGVAGAMLSRATAGVAGRCIVINLPGSTGGVRDGLRVIAPVIEHLVQQVRGGDH